MYIRGTESSYMQQMNTGRMQRPSAGDVFSRIDSNGDDAVSKSELSSIAAKIESKTGNSIDVEEGFDAYDSDGDGSLNSSELESFMKANRPERPEGMPPGGMTLGRAGAMMDVMNERGGTDSELFSILEEASENTSSANTYLELLQVLQQELDEKDEESEDETSDDYLSSLTESDSESEIDSGVYSELSITA